MRPVAGTFNDYPVLGTSLPPLVRRQRRLEHLIATIGSAVADEKAVRKEIDELLVAAGLKKGELVTCAGYDVKHNERKGQDRLNVEALATALVAAGVDAELIADEIKKATKADDDVKFASVEPSKGAKVRAEKT